MNEAIELPSAANPLAAETLFAALNAAASADQQQIQTAAQQLQNWESHDGFYSLLQDIFIDQSLPLDVRYLSIIQLKNGIDKYWRKTASKVISKHEKSRIRARLLQSGIEEADRRLALQNALVTAKVVRFEYPNEWPDVIPSIVAHLRSAIEANPTPTPLILPRTLMILLYVVKELSTARLQRSRTSLQSITPEVVYVLSGLYVNKYQRWRTFFEEGGDDEGGAVDAIDQTLMIIKVLRRLLIAGYEFPNRDRDVCEFWSITRRQFGDFLNLLGRDFSSPTSDGRHLVEKHLFQLTKLHLTMARDHPAAFVLLPGSMELVSTYWDVVVKQSECQASDSQLQGGKIISGGDADEDEKPLVERLALRSLLLLRACVKLVFSPAQTFKYRQPQQKHEQKLATDLVKAELLTETFVRQAMELIVARLLVFGPDDLREWNEEPEEWERRDESDAGGWEFSIRPCAEKLFLDLVIHHKDLLLRPLLNVFESVSTSTEGNVLFKDAVYTAIGLSAGVLHRQLDFDHFLTTRLIAEVQENKPGYNILRRRIAILLGQWVSVRISAQSRPVVYQVFVHLLNKDEPLNDQIVRVTAGKQFKHVADEMEFSATAFLPYAPYTLGAIMALIQEVELTDTKLALLHTIDIIVERMEHSIVPFAQDIVSLLAPLWERSGAEHLLKQAILTILTKLINAMKEDSQRFHRLVVPLIKHAVEPGSDSQVYLLEDALDLWAAILVQTHESARQDVLSLAPYLFSVFDLGTEHLRKGLEITESYILLAPNEMLDTEMRTRLLTSLTSLLGTLKPVANGMVTHLVDVIVREADRLGKMDAVNVIALGLAETGFMFKLVDGLRGSWKARQTTGPNRTTSAVDGVVETDYFGVLARLAIADPHCLINVLRAVNIPEGAGLDQVMNWVLTEWFAHFENIGHPIQRKLNCLALTCLLTLGTDWILGRLQDLMTVWTDVIAEVREGAAEDDADNLIFYNPEELEQGGPSAPEDRRRRALSVADPVRRVNLIHFVRSQLEFAIRNAGGEKAFQSDWLVNVDPDVVSSFQRLGIM